LLFSTGRSRAAVNYIPHGGKLFTTDLVLFTMAVARSDEVAKWAA